MLGFDLEYWKVWFGAFESDKSPTDPPIVATQARNKLRIATNTNNQERYAQNTLLSSYYTQNNKGVPQVSTKIENETIVWTNQAVHITSRADKDSTLVELHEALCARRSERTPITTRCFCALMPFLRVVTAEVLLTWQEISVPRQPCNSNSWHSSWFASVWFVSLYIPVH